MTCTKIESEKSFIGILMKNWLLVCRAITNVGSA
jgi:hypothetical protein